MTALPQPERFTTLVCATQFRHLRGERQAEDQSWQLMGTRQVASDLQLDQTAKMAMICPLFSDYQDKIKQISQHQADFDNTL